MLFIKHLKVFCVASHGLNVMVSAIDLISHQLIICFSSACINSNN